MTPEIAIQTCLNMACKELEIDMFWRVIRATHSHWVAVGIDARPELDRIEKYLSTTMGRSIKISVHSRGGFYQNSSAFRPSRRGQPGD